MRTLLGSATILNGILAGATADRFVVGIPALRKLGVRTWAEYSRHADLAPAGMAFYPTLAIGGTILTIAAATRDRRAIPAAVLAAAGLLVTFKAAPNMLVIRDLDRTATEAVKNWKLRLLCRRMQPSRTLRRKGRGMQGEHGEELERPSSARAQASREGVGAGHSTACRQETTQLPPREGPAVGLRF